MMTLTLASALIVREKDIDVHCIAKIVISHVMVSFMSLEMLVKARNV